MSIVWVCPLDVDTYVERGREIESPRPACPLCSLQRQFARAGLNVRPDGAAPRAYGRLEASEFGELAKRVAQRVQCTT